MAFIAFVVFVNFFNSAHAKDIVVSAGHIPPHMTQDGKGREAEIISATLESCGYRAKFIVQPFTRHWDKYKNDTTIDAVATVPAGLDLPGAKSTTTYVNYHNGALILGARGLTPQNLDDLSGLNVVAFAGANSILAGLKAAQARFKSYRETSDQLAQSRLLLSQRADAVIGDGMIFAEYLAQLQAQNKKKNLRFDPNQSVRFSAIFTPSPYHMVFRDPALQQDFDRCYAKLKETGKIDAINRAYVARYRATIGNAYQGL